MLDFLKDNNLVIVQKKKNKKANIIEITFVSNIMFIFFFCTAFKINDNYTKISPNSERVNRQFVNTHW